jgi:protein MpaA
MDGPLSHADGQRHTALASSGSAELRGVPRVYVSAGIHGDETSGPLALLQMLRQPDFFAVFDTTMFPILNPNGLARGVRFNADGIDLNRDYRNSRSLEIQSHIKTLLTLGRFDAAMMLHEDVDGIGAYLYELNEVISPTLGSEIIAAMGRHESIDLRPEIEEVHGGVISSFIGTKRTDNTVCCSMGILSNRRSS